MVEGPSNATARGPGGSRADARRRARRGGVPETHGKVIAELMFGFWRFVLDARHSPTLWAPALRHAFPHLRPKVRTDVYDRVERLNALRNRVAHHEPIHQVPLDRRWQDLLTVAVDLSHNSGVDLVELDVACCARCQAVAGR